MLIRTETLHFLKFHYNDVIMSALASQITSLASVCSTVYPMRRSKKTSKLLVTGLCAGNSPVTGEFPAQGASNAANASIWWRHNVVDPCKQPLLTRMFRAFCVLHIQLQGSWCIFDIIQRSAAPNISNCVNMNTHKTSTHTNTHWDAHMIMYLTICNRLDVFPMIIKLMEIAIAKTSNDLLKPHWLDNFQK